MDELFCVVHYKNSALTDSKMKNISWLNRQNIYEAKRLRKEIGGDNYHEEQCLLLPVVVSEGFVSHISKGQSPK